MKRTEGIYISSMIYVILKLGMREMKKEKNFGDDVRLPYDLVE